MQLHEKLRRLVKPYKLSAVCNAAGICFPTLRYLLAGSKSPTLETARKLSEAFGVEMGWLVDDDKEWPPVRVEVRALDQFSEEPAAA